jgi:hypothetical protein
VSLGDCLLEICGREAKSFADVEAAMRGWKEPSVDMMFASRIAGTSGKPTGGKFVSVAMRL